MLKKIFLFIFIGGIFYLFGAVTVHYKLFPFSEIVKIRSYFSDIDNFGKIISLIGLGLTSTVIFAEVGIPLMAIGSYVSLSATVVNTSSYFYEGRIGKGSWELGKGIIEYAVPKGASKLITPSKQLFGGYNQEIGEEVISHVVSEVGIPIIEQGTKTVN